MFLCEATCKASKRRSGNDNLLGMRISLALEVAWGPASAGQVLTEADYMRGSHGSRSRFHFDRGRECGNGKRFRQLRHDERTPTKRGCPDRSTVPMGHYSRLLFAHPNHKCLRWRRPAI